MASKLERLIAARCLFAFLLLISTYFSSRGNSSYPFNPLQIWIYSLVFCLIFLSLFYHIYMKVFPVGWLGGFVQISLDSIAVTAIIYLTGGFASIFTFLYLIVIIYAGIILYRQGSLLVTVFCSIQFIGMVGLQYLGRIHPYLYAENVSISSYSSNQVAYKVAVTILAFVAVAVLSSILAEQNRKSKVKLKAMAERVRRVEKLAAMGEMAAGLAHEIKNPLAAMSGSVQLLKEDLPPDPGREQLMKIVLREADRLTSLINDFLLFARPPEGRVENIELKKIITQTLELFANDNRFAVNVDVETELIPGVSVRMDAALLRQVLWNLLLNAAESFDRQGRIKIAMRKTAKGSVQVKISDNGCGIPAENMDAVFDPFFTTKAKGTGLGLSIVHSILESSGVPMEVTSRPGKGTTFRLTMPTI